MPASTKPTPRYSFTHKQLWTAIDRLAKSNRMSTSSMAVKAGLDPTSLNPSKRLSPTGKPRWPNTDTLSRLLHVSETTLGTFAIMMALVRR